MHISDWSSDVCSSDLLSAPGQRGQAMIERLRRLRPSSLLLLAFCLWSVEMAALALAGLGGGYHLHPANPDLVPAPPEVHFPAANGNRVEATPTLAAAERPLFSVDRRPQADRVSDEAGQSRHQT